VAETPAEVARLVRDWQAGIVAASGAHPDTNVVPLRSLRPRA
jgi:hypothetical protein